MIVDDINNETIFESTSTPVELNKEKIFDFIDNPEKKIYKNNLNLKINIKKP
jgi:hypothetical protein